MGRTVDFDETGYRILQKTGFKPVFRIKILVFCYFDLLKTGYSVFKNRAPIPSMESLTRFLREAKGRSFVSHFVLTRGLIFTYERLC